MRFVAFFVAVLFGLTHSASAQTPRTRVGAQVGLAFEQPMTEGPASNVRLALFQPQMSVALIGRQAPYPILAWFSEITIAESLQPSRRLILAANQGFRLGLAPRAAVGPYLEFGAGIGSSALHAPAIRELDGWLQYHLQAGYGLRINVGKDSLRLGYRFTHFSNHGTTLPNYGLNLHMVLIGYEHPF
jgi:hypothetical protein